MGRMVIKNDNKEIVIYNYNIFFIVYMDREEIKRQVYVNPTN